MNSDLRIATEMPSGAISRGFSIREIRRRAQRLGGKLAEEDQDVASTWFAKVLAQMQAFNIPGSAVSMYSGNTEVLREEIK